MIAQVEFALAAAFLVAVAVILVVAAAQWRRDSFRCAPAATDDSPSRPARRPRRM